KECICKISVCSVKKRHSALAMPPSLRFNFSGFYRIPVNDPLVEVACVAGECRARCPHSKQGIFNDFLSLADARIKVLVMIKISAVVLGCQEFNVVLLCPFYGIIICLIPLLVPLLFGFGERIKRIPATVRRYV